ncbi:MAG: UDP-3-O-acyl-N-acetylglucosamine deacetylase [Holophagaceae bacterium]|nr:UDP-3-O-acyl-N-acetylglucosamine deacetylase [Holophagaceae bacterium]
MPRPATARTIAAPFMLKGHGLHRNKPCAVRVAPAENGGLNFFHLPSGVVIPARAEYVGDLSLATTLAKDGVHLQTVEHILSALFGLGVDHAAIEVDGDELPILDGSAAPWVKAISQVGLIDLPVSKRFVKVLRKVGVHQEKRWIAIGPHDGLRIGYTIDFPGSSIGRQSMEVAVTPDKYRRELAPARTFCLKSEIDHLRSCGLAVGGNLDNAVVYDGDGCLNESLRFENEAVRHKMMDLVGDLALLGAPILGRIEAHAAGHAMHVALVRQLLLEPDAWTIEEAGPAHCNGLFQPDFAQGLAV